MSASLRALERALILERTELALRNALIELQAKWDPVDRHDVPKPSSFHLLDALHQSGVPLLPAVPSAMGYIDRCVRQGEVPDLARIFRTLLPEAPVPPILERYDSDDL